jgi:peptidoglycan-N-acetylglucosamine deacetylase
VPAPTVPYRHGGGGLLELPISVTPIARLHVIGMSVILAPAWMRRHLVGVALRAPFFNLELHGIDLADAAADEIPPALVARQPDLRRPLGHKLAALDETLTAARAAGDRFVTLRDYAGA